MILKLRERFVLLRSELISAKVKERISPIQQRLLEQEFLSGARPPQRAHRVLHQRAKLTPAGRDVALRRESMERRRFVRFRMGRGGGIFIQPVHSIQE